MELTKLASNWIKYGCISKQLSQITSLFKILVFSSPFFLTLRTFNLRGSDREYMAIQAISNQISQ